MRTCLMTTWSMWQFSLLRYVMSPHSSSGHISRVLSEGDGNSRLTGWSERGASGLRLSI